MEEELCSRCYRSASEVKLLDAIDNTKMIKICEECAIADDAPIIRKPSSFQLYPSKKSATVYERLSKMTGVQTEKAQQQIQVQEVMRKITMAEPSQLSIKQRQALAKKANKPLNLIDNFHWHIQMARRKRKISQAQLAEAIGEQEATIKIIESGKLTDDATRIINKIEQYLGLKLTKQDYEAEQARIQTIRQPSRVLSFDQESLKSLTISDLIEMKKQREAGEKKQSTQKKETQAGREKSAITRQTSVEQSEESQEDIKLTKEDLSETNLLGNDIELIDEE